MTFNTLYGILDMITTIYKKNKKLSIVSIESLDFYEELFSHFQF